MRRRAHHDAYVMNCTPRPGVEAQGGVEQPDAPFRLEIFS
jgi:hypothetical protein